MTERLKDGGLRIEVPVFNAGYFTIREVRFCLGGEIMLKEDECMLGAC